MSWSYDDGMSSDKDRVRFLIGDTDSADPILSDGEVLYALDEEGGVRAAAAFCCDAIAAKYARLADISEGQLSISYSQRYGHYTAKATQLRSRVAVLAPPTAGGISVAEKDAAEADTDRVVPAFTVRMLDNPETAASDDEVS